MAFFQDFPVLENARIEFQDFPGFPGPVQTLSVTLFCKYLGKVTNLAIPGNSIHSLIIVPDEYANKSSVDSILSYLFLSLKWKSITSYITPSTYKEININLQD